MFERKVWTDRAAANLGRRRLTNADTGEQMLVDVTREEGEVTAEGDAFSAANMNDLEERIEEALTSGYVFYINTDRQLVVRYAEGYEPPPLSIKDRQLVYTIS